MARCEVFRAVRLVALLVSMSMLGPSPTRAQEFFPLLCRGGGAVTIDNHADFRLDHGTMFATFKLRFEHGMRPAGARGKGLAPGTCAWLDRGMRAEEGREIHIHGRSLPASFRVSFLSTNSVADGPGPVRIITPLDDLTDEDEVLQFSAREVVPERPHWRYFDLESGVEIRRLR